MTRESLVSETNLPARLKNRWADFHEKTHGPTVGALLDFGEAELLRGIRVGAGTISRAKEIFAEHGLVLKK